MAVCKFTEHDGNYCFVFWCETEMNQFSCGKGSVTGVQLTKMPQDVILFVLYCPYYFETFETTIFKFIGL